MSEKQARKHREEIEARNNPMSKMSRICDAMAAECDNMTLDKVIGIVSGAVIAFIDNVSRQMQLPSGDSTIHDAMLGLYGAYLSRLKETRPDDPLIVGTDEDSGANDAEMSTTIGLYEITDASEDGSNPQISD